MDYLRLYTTLISFRNKNILLSPTYFETHHILPKCLGGDNSSSNLVRLTGREHFIAHVLLNKIFPNNMKLKRAITSFRMKIKERGTKINSRQYEILKTLHGECASRSMKLLHTDKRFSENLRSNNYDNIEVKRRISEKAKERWKEKCYRDNMSETNREISLKVWCDKAIRERYLESFEKVREEQNRPWKRPATKRDVWELAALFYELKDSHSYANFSDTYECGQYKNIFYKMQNMFKSGWIPLEDKEYTNSFPNYLK